MYGSRFARNIILSRLLLPDEFGTAVAISVVIGLASLVSDVALDRFVMINSSPKALSAAHVLSVARGGLLALALLSFAPGAAILFGVPQFTVSFALAALVPLVQGFGHLSIKRMRLNFGYGPESASQLAANLVAVAALWAAAIVLRDHRAIVISFVTEALVYVILSHMLASTPYRVRTTKSMVHEALFFGLPLTLNGIGLAVISQLDRALAGYWFGVETLATYAVIISMSVVPVSLILGMFGPLGFSYLLSQEKETRIPFEKFRLLGFFFSTISVLYVLSVVLALDILTPIVFGSSFRVNPTVHIIVAAVVCLRLQRSGAPTIFLMASGLTGQLAILNLSAGSGLIVAIVMMAAHPTLESMLLGVLIGDAIAFAFFFYTVYKRSIAREIVTDLAMALGGPSLIIGVLAWSPGQTWKDRGLIFGIGLFAVGVQSFLQWCIYKYRLSIKVGARPRITES
jgi:O-antigen/teichoic acid export membrane protein